MAAKTEYLNLKGKVKWVNGRSGGLFTQDPEYGSYKLNLYPDQESWEKIKKSGLDLKARNDEDGDYIIFRRPHEKLFMGDRKATVFGPPKVFFVEGITPTKEIGNNSEVEATIVVYQAGKYKGHRIHEVVVTNLVEYERRGRDGLVEFKPEGENPEAEEEDDSPFEPDEKIPFGDSKEEEKPTKSVSPFKKRG